MLTAADDEDAVWDLISEQSEMFIWDEYGDELEQWESVAEARGLPLVGYEINEDEQTLYDYKDKTVVVPLLNDRGDNTIAVHTLGTLVYPDIELRLSVDTMGNSERAFMPLTPAEWADLERQFGVNAVALLFTKLGANIDEMYALADPSFDARFA
jgi:hypothetical protein